MQPGVEPKGEGRAQFYGQTQYVSQEIQQPQGVFPEQQVIVISYKYQPDFNFRNLSYLIFGAS